ncbi:MAG TPA: alanine dehydrogenase [Anaerolineales bacterium]|nr:alanine dehydrogenase [Anaerolineales bacterium]HNA90118.1 alanine dehydrogenase [Anaerolineales bacterium]HNB36390.1 alanine dehydrogenase [Anaerolineales bacterium]HNC08008.1 alanine dehydrogenase [Anaerolineales bacterium]
MYIGIPKESRPYEYRVGLSPAGVEILSHFGHQVFIEHDAGSGAGFSDQEYERVGAKLVYSPQEVFGRADFLLKISRPLKQELEWLRDGSILAGFLHLASSSQDQIDLLLEKKVTALAYEQITDPSGGFAVLRPFSQICGAMVAQIAARLLQTNRGGKGILLSGLPGVPPAEVVILGGGAVGTAAARSMLGAGAHVTVLDKNMSALEKLADRVPGVVTLMATKRNIERSTAFADVLVGAVLVSGQRAPVVVTREMVKAMKPRSVIIDASIDQGGCIETSRPTMHDNPTFIEENAVHYCVPNIPSLVARTASHVFVNSAIPYIADIANHGIEVMIKQEPSIEAAVNTHQGNLVNLVRLSA